MSDRSKKESDSSKGSYDPHRSSLRLKKNISMEMLSLFEPYLRRVAMREWRRSLAAKESVSDLVQESLAAGVRDFTAFEGTTEGEMAAWLRRILLRVMHTKLRKFKTQKADIARESSQSASEVSSDQPTPSEIMNQLEQRIRLEVALQEIAPNYRQVIELHHIEGLTFPEIGNQIGKTAEAARKLWVRGLVALQQRLGDLTSTLKR
jgi:RNA polymerase sigma-70 factor, ECF subfamily